MSKGSRQRGDPKKYAENWERIFSVANKKASEELISLNEVAKQHNVGRADTPKAKEIWAAVERAAKMGDNTCRHVQCIKHGATTIPLSLKTELCAFCEIDRLTLALQNVTNELKKFTAAIENMRVAALTDDWETFDQIYMDATR